MGRIMAKRRWPSPASPCDECGSTLPFRHTKECSKDPEASHDLPCKPGSKHWTSAGPMSMDEGRRR